MRFVPASEEGEVLKDTTEADMMKRAAARKKLIVGDMVDETLHDYNSQGVRSCRHPGMERDPEIY